MALFSISRRVRKLRRWCVPAAGNHQALRHCHRARTARRAVVDRSVLEGAAMGRVMRPRAVTDDRQELLMLRARHSAAEVWRLSWLEARRVATVEYVYCSGLPQSGIISYC